MMRSKALVPKMTVCVTFGAPRFGPENRHIWRGSKYVTFYTISETVVRETLMCVTFGAPFVGVVVPSCRGEEGGCDAAGYTTLSVRHRLRQ